MKRNRRIGDYIVLLVFLALGAFVGDLLGELLSPYAPIVGRYARLGFSPVDINLLHLVEFTFGLSFRLNILGAVFGALLIVFLWSK
ncbi:MAG: DUF4321 domain-containing protein [Clostridia bacterium]